MKSEDKERIEKILGTGLIPRELAPDFTDDDPDQALRALVDMLLGEIGTVHKKAKDPKESKPKGVPVTQNLNPTLFKPLFGGAKRFRIGVVSDNHINSKYTQITFLHRFYQLAYSLGVRDFFNIGDIDEGEEMRAGHKYECYTQGTTEHVNEICRVYPQIEGATTYFITGNHDASHMKRSGVDIGEMIASKRSDMIFLGRDCAIVELAPGCHMELRHPWDGAAYAISYKSQKMIDAMSGGEKPKILLVGHYHKAEYIFYRNIHCLQAGTTCAQTPFMKGKSIAAHTGGWIVDFEIDETGTVIWFSPTFIPQYYAIPEDYLNWR